MRPSLAACSMLLALLTASPAWALSSDREQPIAIEADRLEIDERQGISRYQGRVRLSQGTLHLEADQVTIYSEQRRLRRVIAQGQPARLRQRPDGATDDIEAEARQIEFDADSGLLVFTGQAELRQGGSLFRGERIAYDSRNDSVRASGDPGQGQRIQVIIQPQTGTAD